MRYLEIKRSDFFKTVDKFRSPHIWKKVKNRWKLRHTVNKDGKTIKKAHDSKKSNLGIWKSKKWYFLLGKILALKGCEYSFEPELLPYIINLKDHLSRHKWKEIYQGYIEEELFLIY